jgi:hypothetical protein
LDAFGTLPGSINAVLPQSALVTMSNPALSIDEAREVVINLVCTIQKREEEHAIKQNIFQQRIHNLEDKVGRIAETFCDPPEGYVENNDHYPSLTIPIRHGRTICPKWLKPMPDGTVAMLGPDAGPNTAPHFAELYAFPDYASIGPYEPMPGWFRQLLVGPTHIFNTLRGELENLDDWGIVANAIWFRC